MATSYRNGGYAAPILSVSGTFSYSTSAVGFIGVQEGGSVACAAPHAILSCNRGFGGDIAEIIIYKSAFDAAHVQEITDYLATKYGISAPH